MLQEYLASSITYGVRDILTRPTLRWTAWNDFFDPEDILTSIIRDSLTPGTSWRRIP